MSTVGGISSEVTSSDMLVVDSGMGVISAIISCCGEFSNISSGVTGEGEGAAEGADDGVDRDPQKDRLRVDPNPTVTLGWDFRVWAYVIGNISKTR